MEEGKFKDNVLVAACIRKGRSVLGSFLGSTKLRERVDHALAAAQRAAQIAQQRADIAQARLTLFRGYIMVLK